MKEPPDMKRLFTALFAVLLCCAMQPSHSLTQTQGKKTMVKLHTNHGTITLQLDAEKAPNTVKNFLEYVNSGFYDNTIFHRVIPNFMIQGGCPLGNGTGGPGYQFEDEIVANLKFDKPGLLAMATRGCAGRRP